MEVDFKNFSDIFCTAAPKRSKKKKEETITMNKKVRKGHAETIIIAVEMIDGSPIAQRLAPRPS